MTDRRAASAAKPARTAGRPATRAKPYVSGLSLLRQLGDGPWAGELVAASGEGEGQGLQRLRFEYRVWMRTRDGFDRAPDGSAEADATLATQTDVP